MQTASTTTTTNNNNNNKSPELDTNKESGWWPFNKGPDKDQTNDNDNNENNNNTPNKFLFIFPDIFGGSSKSSANVAAQNTDKNSAKKWPWEVYYRGEIPFFENKNITAGGLGQPSTSSSITSYDENDYDDMDYTLPNPTTEAVKKSAFRMLNFWRTTKKGVIPKKPPSVKTKGKNDMITALMVQELEDVPVTENEVPGERAFREAQEEIQGLALKQYIGNNNTPPGYEGKGKTFDIPSHTL